MVKSRLDGTSDYQKLKESYDKKYINSKEIYNYINTLEKRLAKARQYVKRHTIEYVDPKFEVYNVMVKFNEYSNPQELLDIIDGNDNYN